MLNHVYKWPNIVIGNNIDAVLDAFKNESCLFVNHSPFLHSFDTTDHEIDLGVKTFPSPSSCEDVWAELSYLQYGRGLNPFTNRIKKIRFFDGSRLKVTTKAEKIFDIEFDNATLYDLQNVHGLPDTFEENILGYRVLDWFDVKRGAEHPHSSLTDESSQFVKKITFFRSTRVDGKHDKKDLVCESYLDVEQIKDSNYSDTFSRLKAIHMMKKAGIEKIKLEFWKRQASPIKKKRHVKVGNITYMR